MLKSVCLKEEHCVCIESSIVLQSCIIWIVSALFCLSIRNKHFLKLSMASEFKKNFLILAFIFLIADSFIFEIRLSNNTL